MSTQNPDLTMVALGIDGHPESWFGPPLENGVHLRWAFQPQLGFPANGFTLYRRPHAPGNLIEMLGTDLSSPTISFPEIVRRVEADFSNPSSLPEVSLESPPLLLGFNGTFQLPVDSHSNVRAGRATVTLEHEAITAIRVEYQSSPPKRDWHLDRVRHVPVSKDVEDTAWTKLGTICLPFTAPNYLCHPGNPNDSADLQEAARRIPGGFVSNHYLGNLAKPSEHWEHLHRSLQDLCNPPIPQSIVTGPSTDPSSPTFVISPLDLLLSASIDPYIARILGLYCIDRPIVSHPSLPGGGRPPVDASYDYKIEGNWSRSQLMWPEVTVDFETEPLGRAFRSIFPRENLIISSTGRASIVNVDGAPWNDTRRGLDIELSDKGSYLRIHPQEPVVEVQLYLQILSGLPELQVFHSPRPDGQSGGASGIPWFSEDRRFAILTARVNNKDDSIEFVSLQPMEGSPELHIALCRVGLISTWSPPFYETRTWIVYNQKSTVPAPLPKPTGLAVKSIPTPARELENGAMASGPRAGLRWNVSHSDEVLLPGQPVRYVVQRQALGSGARANPIADADWQTIWQADQPAVPITVAIADVAAPYFFIDDPAVALGQLGADRFYAYRIAGVDLFGRQSPYSDPAVGDLTDKEPPPAPINVEAKYFERSDLDLTEEAAEWLDSRSAPSGLQVRWEWPPSLHRQAPDAREFRVYAQRGRLNAIVGQVTQITPNTDGTFTVRTNQKIPNDKTDAFVGESFFSGEIYFTVLHNTAGENIEVTVRPPKAPPPAIPAIGPFTLSMRPPRFLEGSILKIRRYFTGTRWKFTLMTDQDTDTPMNALAGKWLRQSGHDYRIESNTTSSKFRIIVEGMPLSFMAPGKGGFVVVEDQVINGVPTRVPVSADRGNLLYADFRHPGNWAERLHVEPIEPPVKGMIIEINVDPETGTALVSTDQSLYDPTHRFDRGTLVNRGQEFPVSAHTVGPKLELRVLNLLDPNDVPIIPSLGSFEYHMGYQTILPYDIGGDAVDPVVYAQVALSTADDKDYISDNPRWNGTPGNEGMVTASVVIQKVRRIQHQRPGAPNVGSGLATPANFGGLSFITLNWQNVNGMHYEIYRALDEAMFSADRKARPTRSTDRNAYPWLTNEEFDALVAQTPAYSGLADNLLKALASLPGNESAFGLVTPAAIEANTYIATLNGRAANRYCFALKFVDAAGNKSVQGWPSKPVPVPDVMPPRAPVITQVLGGDRQITIKWEPNRESDLKAYRIYRTETEDEARDIRLMKLVAEPGPASVQDEESFIDNSLSKTGAFYYRLVAVDKFGNESLPSFAIAARAFDDSHPDPPIWNPPKPGPEPDTIVLSWTSPINDLSCLVQRRLENSSRWINISRWLPHGNYSFTDMDRHPGSLYEYRLRVRDGRGRQNSSFNPRKS